MGVVLRKVAFLGRKTVATQCFKHVLELRRKGIVDIVGALSTRHVLDEEESVVSLCEREGVPLLASLEDYLALPEVDVLFSVQYERILTSFELSKASELNVNLHMAPLPEYRGCNQFSWALLDGAEEFGTTLHVMNERIDNGDILFEKRFPIPAACWVEDLYALTVAASVQLFAEHAEQIVTGDYTRTKQSDISARTSSLHFRDEISEMKRVDLSWEADKIHAHVRATSMPGFPPPYYIADGQQQHIVASRYALRNGRLERGSQHPVQQDGR